MVVFPYATGLRVRAVVFSRRVVSSRIFPCRTRENDGTLYSLHWWLCRVPLLHVIIYHLFRNGHVPRNLGTRTITPRWVVEERRRKFTVSIYSQRSQCPTATHVSCSNDIGKRLDSASLSPWPGHPRQGEARSSGHRVQKEAQAG